jgi:hypothetical protein
MMPRFVPIGMDQKVHIKGGEKFLVLKPNELLPDGRFRPRNPDESPEAWRAYCHDRIVEATADLTQTSAQVRTKLIKMFGLPDDLKGTLPEKMKAARDYLANMKTTVDMHVEAFKSTQALSIRKRYDQVAQSVKLVLEPNDVSRVHRMTEGQLVVPGLEAAGRMRLDMDHVFVVRHDWLAAMGDRNIVLSEWHLPYDACLFEYRVGGHTVIVHAQGHELKFFMEVERDIWYDLQAGEYPIKEYLRGQIAAACVVLDADVAYSTKVVQPAALNKKREKSGKVPLMDYHVIDLTKSKIRTASAAPTEDLAGPCMRLHFVRGHKRKLPSGDVTWVKWHLRGDGDLGFVDKHYKL